MSLQNAEDVCVKKRCANDLLYKKIVVLEMHLNTPQKYCDTHTNKHAMCGKCSKEQSEFLLSNLKRFKFPHFYNTCKHLNNSIHIVFFPRETVTFGLESCEEPEIF